MHPPGSRGAPTPAPIEAPGADVAPADNEGHARVGKGQKLDDAQILQMNWLVDGVRTPLPR